VHAALDAIWPRPTASYVLSYRYPELLVSASRTPTRDSVDRALVHAHSCSHRYSSSSTCGGSDSFSLDPFHPVPFHSVLLHSTFLSRLETSTPAVPSHLLRLRTFFSYVRCMPTPCTFHTTIPVLFVLFGPQPDSHHCGTLNPITCLHRYPLSHSSKGAQLKIS
jgi:hypothetical protein